MPEFRMTKWQRGILLGMALMLTRDGTTKDVWLTRRALGYLMWFDWHGSHTKRMKELIEHGWIEKQVNHSGVIVYRLTNAARQQVVADVSGAVSCSHYVERGEDKLL